MPGGAAPSPDCVRYYISPPIRQPVWSPNRFPFGKSCVHGANRFSDCRNASAYRRAAFVMWQSVCPCLQPSSLVRLFPGSEPRQEAVLAVLRSFLDLLLFGCKVIDFGSEPFNVRLKFECLLTVVLLLRLMPHTTRHDAAFQSESGHRLCVCVLILPKLPRVISSLAHSLGAGAFSLYFCSPSRSRRLRRAITMGTTVA